MTTTPRSPNRPARASTTSRVAAESSAIRQAILRDLTPSERLLVVLRYAEGLNDDEIGAVVNLSPHQIERRIDRIIAILTGRATQARSLGA